MKALKAINLSNPWILVGIVSLFTALSLYASLHRVPFLWALPLLIIAYYFIVYQPKKMLVFLVFATPLSFGFENVKGFGGIGFYFPTEPLLLVLMVLYLLKLLSGLRESRDFLKHPLTIAIIINLLWIGTTVLFSSMPVVSFKFLLSRLWFVLVMYFMINRFFQDKDYIYLFLRAYIIGMTIVAIYTIVGHASYGFSEDAAHWIMSPFFKDHTSYGAILALFYPLVVYLFYKSPKFSWLGFFYGLIFLIFTIALVLSYTRAAWVGLVGALGVWFLIRFRIDYKVVVLGLLTLVGFYFGFEEQITHRLEKNRQDSSGDIAEHIQSITNISTDASNLERLNRWNSAWRMFEEKPLTGHGPGTYMFLYARYQKSSDRTIISTNQGDGGNAHSEYLGPLSEMGIPGTLSILAIFIISLSTGVHIYYKLYDDKYLQGIVLCMVLGMVTYYLHGFLNNYLDTDKASVPLWGMMSILVAVELYHLDQRKRQQISAVSSK